MADEEVVKLLQEIRDLQKLHMENYKEAVKNQQVGLTNQQSAIEMQKKATRLVRIAMFVLIPLVIVLVIAGVAAVFQSQFSR